MLAQYSVILITNQYPDWSTYSARMIVQGPDFAKLLTFTIDSLISMAHPYYTSTLARGDGITMLAVENPISWTGPDATLPSLILNMLVSLVHQYTALPFPRIRTSVTSLDLVALGTLAKMLMAAHIAMRVSDLLTHRSSLKPATCKNTLGRHISISQVGSTNVRQSFTIDIQDMAQTKFFQRYSNIEKGNCLFTSLAMLSEDRFNTTTMREAICNEHEAMLAVDNPDFILMISEVCESVKHPNDVDCRLNSGNLRDAVRFQNYVTDMRLDCTWGSSLEIHPAASVLNRQIQLYGTCEKTGQSVLLGVAGIRNGLKVLCVLYDNAHYEALKAIHEPTGYSLSLPRMNQMIGTGTPSHRIIQSTSGNNSTKFCRGGMRCEQENTQATHDQTASATLLPKLIVNQSGLNTGTTTHILPGPRDATEYISPELDNMLNTVDTLRCASSESNPLVFMSIGHVCS